MTLYEIHIFASSIFFFQAEDGIRDTSVTGVQTCALPIFRFSPSVNRTATTAPAPEAAICRCPCAAGRSRSEERRVGKECRFWWWGDRLERRKKDMRCVGRSGCSVLLGGRGGLDVW